ncbi:hypothetical protein CAPTEDRAFT_137898, partial [Capitella teleta]
SSDCSNNNGGCEHNCIDDATEKWCSCREGSEVSKGDWRNCDDINECEIGVRGVDYDVDCQICINTKGNYTCGCYEGYELHPNAKLCIGQFNAEHKYI